ncbi:related to ankyrin [Fusarium torulosum]|uniref:Related to ankyrin n=1 Tax=Fusarium torulosum TaxID=33205 RepID=A0AAE8MJ94_9HYPO|nr:related to ankyrin [Fusarium torulosum]
MASSLLHKAESPYRDFTRKPINKYNVFGPPFDVPVTLTDRDGSLIHEREGQDLLSTIIAHNDVEFLEKYFAIDPRAIPNLFELPDGDEAVCDFGDYFRNAAESGSLGILQTLLIYTTKGLDKTKPIRLTRANFQLLNVAAQFGQIEIVQWLLDTQPLYASIHDRDNIRGFTALAAAADLFSFRSCYTPAWDEIRFENNEAIMNLLLDHGACASDVVHPTNDKNRKLPTVLTLAAQWASSDLLERLIDGGADIHYKVAANSSELDFQNQRNVPAKIEVNALFLASFRANPNGVRTLVHRRGDGVDVAGMVCSPDCVGSLPLHWATRNQLPDEHRLIPTSMLSERAGNIARTIEQLLDFAPTTVNIQNDDGNTALHYATRYFGKNGKMYTPVLELLCSRGADASLRNYKNETPLHTLFQSYGDNVPIDPAAVSLLLAHGAKITDADDAGNTPLHVATRNWHCDAVSLLLEHGADPAWRNLKQENALHTTARGVYRTTGLDNSVEKTTEMSKDMIARLVEAGGAELMDLPNADGETARQIFQERNVEWTKDKEV